MKLKRPIRARVNKEGFMNSSSRIHMPKKGKGSFKRSKYSNNNNYE
jgi:stalled ribosome alternative rescue factor ArfA